MNDHMNKDKRWNALRTALLTATAVMLVLSAVMGSAWAYFTTYARAKGGYPVILGHEENEKEAVRDWEKELSITITKDSVPVYVRARAFCADYDLTYRGEQGEEVEKKKIVYEGLTGSAKETWVEKGDGWVYCTVPLPCTISREGVKETSYRAPSLFVKINDVPENEAELIQKGKEFNVIIVYETTEVQNDETGNILPWDKIDWTKKVETHKSSAALPGKMDFIASAKYDGGEKR